MRILLTAVNTPEQLERARSLSPALIALPPHLLGCLRPRESFLTVGIFPAEATPDQMLLSPLDAILLPEGCGIGVINNLRSRTGAILIREITLQSEADLSRAQSHSVDFPLIRTNDPARLAALPFPYILGKECPLPDDTHNIWAREQEI